MLRRKLLVLMLILAALLLALAVAALVSLQGLVSELDHVNTQAATLVDQCDQLTDSLSTVKDDLDSLRSGQKRHLDALIDEIESAQRLLERMGSHYQFQLPAQQPLYQTIRRSFEAFAQDVGVWATTEDPDLAAAHRDRARSAAAQIHQTTLQIRQAARNHAKGEMEALLAHFRMLVLGLALGFLLVINVSVLLLLRAAGWVVRPVEKLVEASRELAGENFDYRVSLDQEGEFAELAQAFNSLAGQLQENERRKIETLGQVALTLNHELNNAMATIEMQLALLRRPANDKQAIEKCLRQIHENLQRMAKVVESLRQVRRIVLTDYLGGMKMLDLEQSTRQESPARSS